MAAAGAGRGSDPAKLLIPATKFRAGGGAKRSPAISGR